MWCLEVKGVIFQGERVALRPLALDATVRARSFKNGGMVEAWIEVMEEGGFILRN